MVFRIKESHHQTVVDYVADKGAVLLEILVKTMEIAKVKFAVTISVKVGTILLLESIVQLMKIAKVKFVLITSVKVSLFCETYEIGHDFCSSSDMF
jgi:hypothetical protein